MPTPKGQETLIKEIRDRYTYAMGKWSPIRDEAKTDMQYIAGDPWDAKDKKAREDAGRPALQMDELNQFTNQAINNLRQNQRGIKVNPAGNGATEQTAVLHQGIIRGIEYRSNAQRSAYVPAFENALQRSYGFFYVKRRYMPGKSFDQEIYLEGEPNPDRVVPDPDARKADWSDANYYFVLGSPLKREEFKRKYPKAQVTDFESEDVAEAGDWLKDDNVLTAEYWKAEKVERKLLLFKTPQGPQIFYDDEVPKGFAESGLKPTKERIAESRKITQYITNGVEILEENESPGEYIPIVPVVGKEIWVDGNRQLISLIRLARDPYMTYCYLWSQMIEEAKQTPKTPFQGYVGQFETDKEAISTITDVPHAFIQFDPIVDGATGQILPLPSRPQFQPNFAAYNIILDTARRAIMSALGLMPMPTSAQRQNEKSGVALDKIQSQESVGSFHFTDNFDRALEYAGRIIESWIPVIYDTEREIGLRHDDGTHAVVKVNTDQPYDQGGKFHHYPLTDENGDGLGNHDIELDTGPSYKDQRDEARDFFEQMVNNIEQWPLPPQFKAKFLALIIRNRNLGPQGDAMADLLDPKQDDPQQSAQKAMAQLQQQAQQMQEMQAELQQLRMEKQGKVIEMQAKQQMHQLDIALETAKLDNARAIAEIQTKAQVEQERQAAIREVFTELHGDAKDVGMQASEQQHEKEMAAQQHQNTLEQGDQAAQNQVAVAAAQPQDQAGQ